MRFAITGTDARFLPLRKLLLADGHEITDPASADMVISPPWDPSARYARQRGRGSPGSRIRTRQTGPRRVMSRWIFSMPLLEHGGPQEGIAK